MGGYFRLDGNDKINFLIAIPGIIQGSGKKLRFYFIPDSTFRIWTGSPDCRVSVRDTF